MTVRHCLMLITKLCLDETEDWQNTISHRTVSASPLALEARQQGCDKKNGIRTSHPPERLTYPRACKHSSMWSCTDNILPVWGSPSYPPCLARSSQAARSCWRPPIPFMGCSHLVTPQPAITPRMQAARHRLPFRSENVFIVSNLIQSPFSLLGAPNRGV